VHTGTDPLADRRSDDHGPHSVADNLADQLGADGKPDCEPDHRAYGFANHIGADRSPDHLGSHDDAIKGPDCGT